MYIASKVWEIPPSPISLRLSKYRGGDGIRPPLSLHQRLIFNWTHFRRQSSNKSCFRIISRNNFLPPESLSTLKFPFLPGKQRKQILQELQNIRKEKLKLVFETRGIYWETCITASSCDLCGRIPNWILSFYRRIDPTAVLISIDSEYLYKRTWENPEYKFNDFEPCLKSAKNRFQLSAGLNLETLNTIWSGTNHIWAASQI